RLIRIQGRYYMQLGVGKSLEITDEMRSNIIWGQTWPNIAVDLGVDPGKFVEAAGSNHYSAIEGDCVEEVKYACREAGVPVTRIDSDRDLAEFCEMIADSAY
ncbi:unnamed protein product, partial [marine sediment metagenome]